MDEFKKYLQDNKLKLDNERFDIDSGWTEIKEKLVQKRNRVIRMRWVVAASLLLCVSVSVFFLVKEKKKDGTTVKIQKKNMPANGIRESISYPDSSKQVAIITDSLDKSVAQTTSQKRNNIPNKRLSQKTGKETEEIDLSFQAMINAQLKAIKKTAFYAGNPNRFLPFKQEYKKYEKEESFLKAEIKTFGMNEEYLNHLIDIYQAKLSLLKHLQSEIQKMNNQVKQFDPGAANRKPTYINI